MAENILADGRNYNRIQHEHLRRKIDPPMNLAKDKMRKTMSKDEYKRLARLFTPFHVILFHTANMKEPQAKQEKPDEYNKISDRQFGAGETDKHTYYIRLVKDWVDKREIAVTDIHNVVNRITAEGGDMSDVVAALKAGGVAA